MKRWPSVPLSDAYWFQEGPGVRKWQFRSSGVKLLNVGNITKEGTLDLSKSDRHLAAEEVAEKYSHFLVDDGDLVMASSGISFDEDGLLRTRGAFVNAHHLPLCLNTSTIRFKPKEGVSSLALLRYWLDSPEFRSQITRLVTGSAQQNFGPSHLKATKISLPSLAEQERIVKLLDEADELRKLRAQADQRTTALIPALFQEMFGESATNQKRWKMSSLGELITDGPQNGLYKHSSFYGEGIPILRIDAFYDGEVEDLKALKRLRATPEEIERYGLRDQDIVINRVNSPEYLGKSALIPALPEPIVFESNMMRLAVSTESVEPGYLIRYLQTPDAKRHILGRAKHSINQSSINQEDVKCLPVPVPPLPLQKEFAERVTEIRELEADQATSSTRLDALFQSMLHRAFNGEL